MCGLHQYQPRLVAQVKNIEEKPLPTATASLLSDTNRFRVFVRHAMHGDREMKSRPKRYRSMPRWS